MPVVWNKSQEYFPHKNYIISAIEVVTYFCHLGKQLKNNCDFYWFNQGACV